jgi:hypothetical protein
MPSSWSVVRGGRANVEKERELLKKKDITVYGWMVLDGTRCSEENV